MTRAEKWRLAALASALVLVVLVGAPLGPLWVIKDVAQRLTEPFGADVSMTPITVDMPGLIDSDGTRLYAEEVVVIPIVGGRALPAVELDAVPFHRFRIPAVLYIEQRVHGVEAPELQHAMCTTLRAETGLALQGFVFMTPRDTRMGGRFGLNRLIPCEAELP